MASAETFHAGWGPRPTRSGQTTQRHVTPVGATRPPKNGLKHLKLRQQGTTSPQSWVLMLLTALLCQAPAHHLQRSRKNRRYEIKPSLKCCFTAQRLIFGAQGCWQAQHKKSELSILHAEPSQTPQTARNRAPARDATDTFN